ncbi:murein L,D-transpeptidase [Microvirga sp. HBU67558]|uniref:L,D-transpeptidase family protein n=1 Tax=Microvirga TaxID=186650 RepID=UPI001B375473|nr:MULTISPECIES: murein L,D-transpeptidase family protein [unclassified Microvirga]MBQ0820453.1 murein L,D-transpeptidase [Microvirga sp. HBU67558]
MISMLRWLHLPVLALIAAALVGRAAEAAPLYPKHEAPIPPATMTLMKGNNTAPAEPMLIRIYKKEAELEVWKRSTSGRYIRLKTFPICRWSGQLGPKQKEGDRQTPEGFYAVTAAQMNPKSKHYLSFDTGFPNAYDRAHGATGSALMVHGTCSSAGCYAMTDAGMAEIYALMREAFRGGQKAVQLQAYPFRMTAENLVQHRLDPNIAFWRQLKEGSDRFEATREELVASVSAGQYTFRPVRDPDTEAEVLAYRAMEDDHMAVLLEEGRVAIRTTYADGGQHPSFTALWRRGISLGEVSRPEALAYAGLERVIAPARVMRPVCPVPGTCTPSSADARAASPPAMGERLVALASLDGPSTWLKELPSLLTSAPVGGAALGFIHDQLIIQGAQEIVPARLAQKI